MNWILSICALLAVSMPSVAFAAWPPLDDVPPVTATTTNDVAVIVAVEDYLLLPDIPGAVDNANEWTLSSRWRVSSPAVFRSRSCSPRWSAGKGAP